MWLPTVLQCKIHASPRGSCLIITRPSCWRLSVQMTATSAQEARAWVSGHKNASWTRLWAVMTFGDSTQNPSLSMKERCRFFESSGNREKVYRKNETLAFSMHLWPISFRTWHFYSRLWRPPNDFLNFLSQCQPQKEAINGEKMGSAMTQCWLLDKISAPNEFPSEP